MRACKPLGAILVLAVSILMWDAGNGLAQETDPTPDQRPRMMCRDRFQALDTDQNGRLTMDEFKVVPHPYPAPEDVFKVIDTDESGYLTVEEFCKGRGTRQGPMGPGRKMGGGRGMQPPAGTGQLE